MTREERDLQDETRSLLSVIVADADRQTAPLADSMLLDDSHLLEAARACSFLALFGPLDTLSSHVIVQ